MVHSENKWVSGPPFGLQQLVENPEARWALVAKCPHLVWELYLHSLFTKCWLCFHDIELFPCSLWALTRKNHNQWMRKHNGEAGWYCMDENNCIEVWMSPKSVLPMNICIYEGFRESTLNRILNFGTAIFYWFWSLMLFGVYLVSIVGRRFNWSL